MTLYNFQIVKKKMAVIYIYKAILKDLKNFQKSNQNQYRLDCEFY